MITLCSSLLLFGSVCTYFSSSQKLAETPIYFLKIKKINKKILIIVGCALFATALSLLILFLGITSGVLLWLFLLSMLLSLCVVLIPLNKISVQLLITLIIISSLIEYSF